jgi:excisionase family DNA binding protein
METQFSPNPFEVIMTEIRQLRGEVSGLMKKLEAQVGLETMDTDQAAKFLGVHKNTLRNMLIRGELRAQRSGRKYIFTREQLYTFLNESDLTGSRLSYKRH